MNPKVRVFLVEDHPLTSAGVRSVLTSEPQCELVGQARTVAEASERLPGIHADTVLLDISLPDGSGLELIEECRARGASVVMLSMHRELSLLSEAFSRGAAAYVSKLADPSCIIHALNHVQAGTPYVCGVTALELLKADRKSGAGYAYASLSRREAEVASFIASGAATQDIAERLHVSVKTVDSHRLSVFRKLKVGSALQLARYTVATQITA